MVICFALPVFGKRIGLKKRALKLFHAVDECLLLGCHRWKLIAQCHVLDHERIHQVWTLLHGL